MIKEIFYLSTCDTCKRIIAESGIGEDFTFHDIKYNPITKEQIERMFTLAGSYESLFSRRARKYGALGLRNKALSEADMKALILSEYTFLKRPVAIIGDNIFIGNAKGNVAKLKEYLLKN